MITPEALPLSGTQFTYVDAGAEAGVTHYYWLATLEADGTVIMNGPVAVTTAPRAAIALTRAPWPNPVTRDAAFEYSVGADAAATGTASVTLAIHDLQGRVVRTLKHASERPGTYRMSWNATNDAGTRVPAGMYYLKLSAGSAIKTVPLSVVR